MPEYLAPGVYVEEIDTGNKPIEGVSTSTAGMLGVTERGPVNVPILITGIGEYNRWFGGRLDRAVFGDHSYLPHAVEGFFTNGGKRAYVTRMLDTELAAASNVRLFDRTMPVPFASTLLLRAASESTGTVANPPPLVVLPDSNLAKDDWVRIGDGSIAEYPKVAAVPAAEKVLVPLSMLLAHSHDVGTNNAQQFNRTPAGGVVDVAEDAQAGASALIVDGATADVDALKKDVLVEIGGSTRGEYRFVTVVADKAPSSAGRRARIVLDAPLALSYSKTTSKVQRITVPAPGAPRAHITPAVRAGDSLLFVNDRGADFVDRTKLVILDRGTASQEVRRIGELRQLDIISVAQQAYEAGSLVQVITLGDDAQSRLTATVAAGLNPLQVNNIQPFRAGQDLLVGPAGGPYEVVTVQSIAPGVAPVGTITLVGPLLANKNSSDLVLLRRLLTASPRAGAVFVALSDRTGLSIGDVLRLSNGTDEEFVEVAALPSPSAPGVWPNPGNVVLRAPILNDFDQTNTQITRQIAPTPDSTLQASVLALAASVRAPSLLVADANGWTELAPPNGRFIQILTPGGSRFYHRVTKLGDPVAPNPPAGKEAKLVTLTTPLARAHPVSSPVIKRKPIFVVQALDAGSWGDRLRLSIEDEPTGLASATRFLSVVNPTRARLASTAGIEPGTILELYQPADGLVLGAPVKVATVNRGNGEVTLDASNALSPAQMGAALALGVRSREFRLTVYLMRQPDPAMPTRNETALDSEVFRHLSMDHRHSRYVHTIIGTTWDTAPGTATDRDERPLRREDRRSEGESRYIRVRDLAQDLPEGLPAPPPYRIPTLESPRPGPESLVDALPDGRRLPARHPLTGGNDSLMTINDNIYIGQDHPTPENRTGLHSLRNIEEISIVACPGRTSVQIQNALINHCELMSYRFAVLDGLKPPNDTLADVQTQRQQFDTKYAALYHPWLLIPDPYPTNLARIADYPIPPSGHMLGVYARTDIERGVHKAPANEVVRGILGLQRVLNKEQHDILNPYPVNINVIRDFRDNNRGIRVFGGRVITSDSDWKYVNVRRLLIFIENSVDRGLQWVVFEPNAEPLWARVRRSISNFLTLAWRNGALEGTKTEEAYFVKCDRTTMTQTDIDSGRLIVVVGVAPVKPAEFVIVRIGLWTSHAED